MFYRLGHLLLALALLGAVGAHWAVLQSVAWTSMIVENTRHEPLGIAVARTLSGERPCDLCKRIAAGKQSEQKPEYPVQSGKLEFIDSQPATSLYPPRLAVDAPRAIRRFSFLPEAPPVPPPRSNAV
jgi:hypothetical protein